MNENGSEGRDINEPKVKDCHEGFDHSSKLRPENSILSQIEDSKSYKLFIDRAVQAQIHEEQKQTQEEQDAFKNDYANYI